MMQTSCKSSAGGQREGEDGDEQRGGEGSLVQLPVSHYLSHLLDRTGDGGIKGTTVV